MGTRRSARYVTTGRKRPIATWWARNGRVPPPEDERRFTKEKKALARAAEISSMVRGSAEAWR